VIEARIGKLRIVDKKPGAMLQFSPSYRVWYASTRIHLKKLDAQGFLGLWKAALADESNHVTVHEPEMEAERNQEETPLEILRKKNVADIRKAEQDFFANLSTEPVCEVAPPPRKRNARKQVPTCGERRRSLRIANTVAVNEEEEGACIDLRACLITGVVVQGWYFDEMHAADGDPSHTFIELELSSCPSVFVDRGDILQHVRDLHVSNRALQELIVQKVDGLSLDGEKVLNFCSDWRAQNALDRTTGTGKFGNDANCVPFCREFCNTFLQQSLMSLVPQPIAQGTKRKKPTDEDAISDDESVLEIEDVTLNLKAAESSSSAAGFPARTHEDSSSEDSSSEDSSSEDSSSEDSSSEDSSSEAEESSSEDASLPDSSDSDGLD